MEKILFSLHNCPKCTQTKELFKDRKDIDIETITLPHDINNWNKKHHKIVNEYNVYDDLMKTAPILCINGKKFIGYLQIKRWINKH